MRINYGLLPECVFNYLADTESNSLQCIHPLFALASFGGRRQSAAR